MPRPGRAQTQGPRSPVFLAQADHLRETRRHPLIAAIQPSTGAPSQPEGPIRPATPALQPAVQHRIVGHPHRPGMASQCSRRRGDQGKKIDHHQAPITPGLRKPTQPPQGWVVGTGISAGGIESAENQGVMAMGLMLGGDGITPATLQQPAITATTAERRPSIHRRCW